MAKSSNILGMNARNRLYVNRNTKRARALVGSKYATKLLMQNNGIGTAQIYAFLVSSEDVNEFDWSSLTKDFVIKPTNGFAGKGVVAFRNQIDSTHWYDVVGKVWSLDDIKLHCFDVLEGQYSIHGSQHNIIVEERVKIHPKLLKYTYKGTPDIRVIVFNSIPVMALLRLPTEESEGRANQTQGAIGVGIDIATGITTYATAHKNVPIRYLPGTKKKLNGILIPFWNQVLETAVKATMASGLIYCGVDLFIDQDKGPLVVELNAAPGLSIQVSNQAGLRRRLERVEDLNVLSAKHGVKIGQALFAESFAQKFEDKTQIKEINYKELVTVYGDNKQQLEITATANTGRFRSAIAMNLAEELGLIDVDDLLWYQQEAEEGKVPVVEVKFRLKNKMIKTAMVVSKRLNKSASKLELGRKDLKEFVVKIEDV